MIGNSASLYFEGDGHNVARTTFPTTKSVLEGCELAVAPSPVVGRWRKAGTDLSASAGGQP